MTDSVASLNPSPTTDARVCPVDIPTHARLQVITKTYSRGLRVTALYIHNGNISLRTLGGNETKSNALTPTAQLRSPRDGPENEG